MTSSAEPDDGGHRDPGLTQPPPAAGVPPEPPIVDETVSLGSYASGGSRYRIVRPISSGGIGDVWLARDIELNRDVALKQLRERHQKDSDYQRRFIREIRAGAALEHPGIVPVYDIGQHPDGRLFQVMRYFGEGTLSTLIRNYHREHPRAVADVPFRTLLGHFVAACRAIAYANAREVIHLDLKPANIVTGPFGETQVIDWGLAWLKGQAIWDQVAEESGELSGGGSPSDGGSVPDMTKPRGFRGTPAYAAPEQHRWQWDAIGPRTDVYGLGATLFFLLAETAPFDPTDETFREDVLAGHLHARPKAWAPPALVAIARKAMAVDPANRYASATDLADEVDRFLADEPVTAFPDPPSVRAWRFVKRHRAAVSSAAALLLTSAIALGVGYAAVSHQRDRALANAAATRRVIADFIESVADDRWATVPGTAELRLGAVRKVLDEYPKLLEQQPDDPDLRYDAAFLDRRCANLYRLLGQLPEAQSLYDRSRSAMEDLLDRHPRRADFRGGWTQLLLDTAEVLLRSAGPEAALSTYREAVGSAEGIVAVEPDSLGAKRSLAQARMDLADVLLDAGDIDEGMGVAGKAGKDFAFVTAGDGGQDIETRNHTRLLASLASVIEARVSFEAGEFEAAAKAALAADRSTAKLSQALPGVPDVDYVRGLALAELGRVLLREEATAGKGMEASARALDILRGLVASDGDVANFRPALADLLAERAEALLAAEDAPAAAKIADEAIAAVAPLDAPTGAVEAKRRLARAHALRGRAAKATDDPAAARDHFRRARGYYDAAVSGAPRNAKIREEAALVERLLAE